MKSLERISFLTNVLVVACQRPSTEVGKLVKALVTYATDGTRTELNDIRLETFFDLIAQDLDMQRMASEEKSRKCSESAKSRTARNGSSANSPTKKANASNATNSKQKADADDANESAANNVSSCSGDADDSCDFDAADVTSSFERMKAIYVKVGNNESQAFDAWRQLSEDERSAAFAHVQRMQGDPNSRNYLFVYLRDKEWTKNVESGKQ